MKFLVVDDHALIREAMRGVLVELQRDAVVLEAGTCGEAMALIQQHADLSLMLLDLKLPDRDGFDVMAELREHHPALSVVMLSAFNDRDNVIKALDGGALRFHPEDRLARRAGQRAAADPGRRRLYPARHLSNRDAGRSCWTGPAGRAARRPSPAELGLTGRQVDVLALMMQGKSNKLICRALDLAEPTVKNHVSAILKALNVSNRTEAVLAVAALGWELPRNAG